MRRIDPTVDYYIRGTLEKVSWWGVSKGRTPPFKTLMTPREQCGERAVWRRMSNLIIPCTELRRGLP